MDIPPDRGLACLPLTATTTDRVLGRAPAPVVAVMPPAHYLVPAEKAKAFLTAADSFAQLTGQRSVFTSFRALDWWTLSRKRDFWR
jgi:hypothetical protein